ncbi:hypothetical protein [Sphingomonas phage Carli]|nr:hypothetical protein [Sphingomonas phage Carli]
MTRIAIDKDLLDRLVASATPLPDVVPPVIAQPTLPMTDTPASAILQPIPANANSPAPPMAWGSKVSATFRARIWWMACTLRMDPNWIMACMAWESGESFSASKKNMAGSGATGLIQFMPDTAKGLGTTTAALAAMTAEDQVNFVYKYFKDAIERHGPLTTLEDTYMSILWPAAIGKPVSAPLWDKATKPTTYRQNAGLDTNKDGTITKFEAANHVREKLAKGLPLAA